jgi:radical SAM protein with 4Fe4S-binding SPASM domain
MEIKDTENTKLLSVGIEVTNTCNLRCKHCYANAGRPLKNELTTDEIKNIIDQLVKMKTIVVALSGGEPLLRKDILEIIKYIKKKGFEIYLNTNGTLITEELAEKIKKCGLSHLEISIDGFKKTHDYIRGKGSFEKALLAFEICKKYEIEVGILTVMMKINLSEIPNLINFFYKKGASGIGLLRFHPVGRGKKNKHLEITTQERKRIIEKIYRIKAEIGDSFPIKVETPSSILIAMNYPKLIEEHKYVFYSKRGCPAGTMSMDIRANGDVVPCSQFPLVIGNIRKQSIKDIWENSPVFKLLRNRENLKGKCGKCKYKNLCGGCRAAAYNKFGDFLLSDPGCWL